MKATHLQPLRGRTIECWYEGQRTAKVLSIVNDNRLTVQFLAYGKRRILLSSVVGVYWYGQRYTVEAYLAKRAKKGEAA